MILIASAQLPPEVLQKALLCLLSYKDRIAFADAFPDLLAHVDSSFGFEILRLPFDKILGGLGGGWKEGATAVRRMVDNGARVTEMVFEEMCPEVLGDLLYELLGQPATQASLTKLSAVPDCHFHPLFPSIFACTALRTLILEELSPSPEEVAPFLHLHLLEHLEIDVRTAVTPADLPLAGLSTLRLYMQYCPGNNQDWFSAMPPMPKLAILGISFMGPGVVSFPWARLPALRELELEFTAEAGVHFFRDAARPQLYRLAWADQVDVRLPALLRALSPTTASRLRHLQLELDGSPKKLRSSFNSLKQLRSLEQLELTLCWANEDTREGTVAADLMRGLLRHLKGLRRLELNLNDHDFDCGEARLDDELTFVEFFSMATSAPPPYLNFVGVGKYCGDFRARKGWMKDGAWSVLRRIKDVLSHAARPAGLALTVRLPPDMLSRYKKTLADSKDPDFNIVSNLWRWQPTNS